MSSSKKKTKKIAEPQKVPSADDLRQKTALYDQEQDHLRHERAMKLATAHEIFQRADIVIAYFTEMLKSWAPGPGSQTQIEWVDTEPRLNWGDDWLKLTIIRDVLRELFEHQLGYRVQLRQRPVVGCSSLVQRFETSFTISWV